MHRGVAQLVARLLWEQDAAGSNPVTPIMSKPPYLRDFNVDTAVFMLHKCLENQAYSREVHMLPVPLCAFSGGIFAETGLLFPGRCDII